MADDMMGLHTYLKEHGVEAKVAAAVARVLRERPANPLVAISHILLKGTTATQAELEDLRQLIAELEMAIADKDTARLASKERLDELKSLAELSPEELASHAERIAQGLAYKGPPHSNDWMVREEAVRLLDKLSDEAVLQHADAFAMSLFDTTESKVRDEAVAARLMGLAPKLAQQVPEVIRHQSHEKELAQQVASSVGQHIEPEVLARRISSSDSDTTFLALSRDANHAELLGQVVKIDPAIAERTVKSGERKGERYADVGIQKCKDVIRAALGDTARLASESRRRELESLAELSPEELASHAKRIAQGLAYKGPPHSNDWMVREEAVRLLDKLSDEAVLQHADAFAMSLFDTTESKVRDEAVAARLMGLAPKLAQQVPEVIRHQSHEKELAQQVASSVGQHIEPEVLARRISSSDSDTTFLALSRDANHAELLGQVVKIDPAIAERTVQSGDHAGWRYADVGIQKCNEAIRAALYHELLIFACSPNISPLPDAQKEAEDVKALFPAGAVELKVGGTAEDLRQMLQKKPTRRFLFAGHGNAPSPGDPATGTVTLGFTRDDGKSYHLNGQMNDEPSPLCDACVPQPSTRLPPSACDASRCA